MPAPEPPSDQTQKASSPSDTDAQGEERTASWAAGGSKPTSTAAPDRIGRYDVREVLGEGAFGRVYRGFDPDLGREVAIKVPNRESLNPNLRERFLREARAAATIHHPNVCPIYDVGTADDLPYIVMRFVPGPTLAGLLAQRATPFPPRHAVAIARKLALGVAEAHAQGVIHRDLKPQNVLWDDAKREVLITDFGLARIGGETRMTANGDVLGTPSYMSPEQARGDSDAVGPLSDLYSLGVILYRMVTGEVPYRGSVYEVMVQAWEGKPRPPSEVLRGLDRRVDALCLTAMAKEPRARYPSARAFAGVLADYLRATEKEETGHSSERPPPLPPTGGESSTKSTRPPKPKPGPRPNLGRPKTASYRKPILIGCSIAVAVLFFAFTSIGLLAWMFGPSSKARPTRNEEDLMKRGIIPPRPAPSFQPPKDKDVKEEFSK